MASYRLFPGGLAESKVPGACTVAWACPRMGYRGFALRRFKASTDGIRWTVFGVSLSSQKEKRLLSRFEFAGAAYGFLSH